MNFLNENQDILKEIEVNFEFLQDEDSLEIKGEGETEVQISSVYCKVDKKKVYIKAVLKGSEYLDKALGAWYIVNALGEKVYFCTKDGLLAQKMCDSYYGKGKYKVRNSSGFKSSGSVTVRANQTTRGQAVQRNKARILNS